MTYRLTPTGWMVVAIILLTLIALKLFIRHNQLINDLAP